MKQTALGAIILLLSALQMIAAPKSSASFEKALSDAEMIAALSPDWSVMRAQGESMGDFYGDNSLLVVQNASIEDIRVGMMVVYQSTSGELVAHKVLQHEGTQLRTKGTANWSMDPMPVTNEMLLGVVFCVFHADKSPAGEVYSSNGAPLPVAHCRGL